MKTDMNFKIFSMAVVGVLLVFTLSIVYVHQNEKTASQTIKNFLQEQHVILSEEARLLYKNIPNPRITTFINDCRPVYRSEFDKYLNQLNTTGKEQFIRPELLFDACADYFADSKAAAVLILREEYETYSMLGTVYTTYNNNANEELRIDDWERYVVAQEKLSDLLQQQIPLQRDIINLLRSGGSLQDEIIIEKTNVANEILQSAAVLQKQVDAIYNRLQNES